MARKYIVGGRVYEETSERKVIAGNVILEETTAAAPAGGSLSKLTLLGVGSYLIPVLLPLLLFTLIGN